MASVVAEVDIVSLASGLSSLFHSGCSMPDYRVESATMHPPFHMNRSACFEQNCQCKPRMIWQVKSTVSNGSASRITDPEVFWKPDLPPELHGVIEASDISKNFFFKAERVGTGLPLSRALLDCCIIAQEKHDVKLLFNGNAVESVELVEGACLSVVRPVFTEKESSLHNKITPEMSMFSCIEETAWKDIPKEALPRTTSDMGALKKSMDFCDMLVSSKIKESGFSADATRHAWVAVKLIDGREMFIDLAGPQFDVYEWNKDGMPLYIWGGKGADSSRSPKEAAIAKRYTESRRYSAGDYGKVTIPSDIDYSSLFSRLIGEVLSNEGVYLSGFEPLSEAEKIQCANCCRISRQLIGGNEKMQRCSRCKSVSYCSRECQAAHWSKHKSNCIPK